MLSEVTKEASKDKHGLGKDITSKRHYKEEKQQDHLLFDEQIQHLSGLGVLLLRWLAEGPVDR